MRLSGRAASTAGAAASAGMSPLTNRCWPCRPVFGKIQTGRGVRILSVDEEGGRTYNLWKISVRTPVLSSRESLVHLILSCQIEKRFEVQDCMD